MSYGIWGQDLALVVAYELEGELLSPVDRTSQGFHPVCNVATGGGWRQRLTVNSIEINCFVYDVAKLFEHLPLVLSMTPTVEQARSAAHVTLIVLGPFDDFGVSGTIFHS